MYLTLTGFDFYLSPEPVSKLTIYLKNSFPDLKLPQHAQVTFPELRKQQGQSLFFSDKKSPSIWLLSSRMLFDNLQAILLATEIDA